MNSLKWDIVCCTPLNNATSFDGHLQGAQSNNCISRVNRLFTIVSHHLGASPWKMSWSWLVFGAKNKKTATASNKATVVYKPPILSGSDGFKLKCGAGAQWTIAGFSRTRVHLHAENMMDKQKKIPSFQATSPTPDPLPHDQILPWNTGKPRSRWLTPWS